MESAPAVIAVSVLLAAFALKATDLTKYIVAVAKQPGDKDAWDGIVTLLVSSALGVVITFLLRKSAWGEEITIGKENLAGVSHGSAVLFGLVFSSVGSTLYDFKKALSGIAARGPANGGALGDGDDLEKGGGTRNFL